MEAGDTVTDLQADPVAVEIAVAERSLDYLRGQLASHERICEKVRQQIAANTRHLLRLEGLRDGERTREP